MSLTNADRFFALRKLPPFRDVAGPHLAAIAATMTEQSHPAGEALVRQGGLPEELLVLVEGSVVAPEGGRVAPLIGLPGLLFGLPARRELQAGPQGATTLALARNHLFAAVQACPQILAAVLESPDQDDYR